MGYHHINMKFFVAFSAVVAMVSAELTPICSDTEPDTDMDSVMLDLRALPVSMLLTCPCLVLSDTSTTERGRLRLSPTSDTARIRRIRIRWNRTQERSLCQRCQCSRALQW